MFSRILVPVDLSDRNGPAVEAAADLAGVDQGALLLLHVIEEIEGVDPSETEDFYQGLRARAETVLADLSERLASQHISTTTQIRTGKRGSEIVRCADEERSDLVVLRSHLLDPEHPARGIGTISHQVALAAPCAVLLVR